MFEATKKRAQKLQDKGQTVDCNDLLAKEPDRGARRFADDCWTPTKLNRFGSSTAGVI